MDSQQGLVSLGGVPIQYVGKKAQKTDNVAGTGLTWTPGQVHIVPPLVAQKLARFADIWREVDPGTVDDDPSSVGMVVTDLSAANSGLAGSKPTAPAGQPPKGEGEEKTFDLPNLQGMTKADLQTYSASQFNHQLDASMKKEDMIQQIVSLANSGLAGAQ